MQKMDISGNWNYKTDEMNVGEVNGYFKRIFEEAPFVLPGSACENKIGAKQEYYEELTKESIRAPRERYEYIAPLWLQREVTIPNEWEGKCICLFLERVNIASMLWIDGKQIDRQIIGLSTPHIYRLPKDIQPGSHVLTLCIDNRNLLNMECMASGYSVDTQGYWNGIIGGMELRCEEVFHIEDVQIYPDENGIDIRGVFTSDVHSPFVKKKIVIELMVETPRGELLETAVYEREIYNSRQPEYFRYEINMPEYWDEFTPALYKLYVKYNEKTEEDKKCFLFGMRTVSVKNKQFMINNRPFSLRGTTDCAIFPLTGYPFMDKEAWKERLSTVKEYGMNHVRFHAWCPPEAAFTAADELGIYVSVEMPLWLNKDVCALEAGEDSIHKTYYLQEAMNISRVYGNHPSFIMFSNGNENMGDFDLLETIIKQVKACDNRRLYTLTTNFDHPLLPCEDYLCAYEAAGKKIRIQDIHDRIAMDSCYTYDEAVNAAAVPLVSFEVGQYCVFPDVDMIERYTGNILPVNLDVIRKRMKEKGIYHRLNDYINASGALAVKLYKEDIEAALRTKGMGGFELLSLSDYTGQSTATIGILDAMYQSKGLVTPEEFRQFCNSVVPLFKAKRIYQNTEIMHAQLAVYDYGKEHVENYNEASDIEKLVINTEFELIIYNGTEVFLETITKGKNVDIDLSAIEKAVMLKVVLRAKEYLNTWNIYVYPAVDSQLMEVRAAVVRSKEELLKIKEAKRRILVTADCVEKTAEGSYIPVFWSPVHFPSTKPCGAMIDETHPIFADFPTEKYPDYQWKALLDSSKAAYLSDFPNAKPIVEFVPNFVDCSEISPLFEYEKNGSKYLYCGFDLEQERPEVRQLKYSIYKYLEIN